MRHNKKGRTLGRVKRQREALMRNLAESLVLHGAITTTVAKAKELRTFIEPLITKAKKADFNSIRQIMRKLPFKDSVHSLVHDIAPNYVDRNGGYTRIIKRGFRDNDRASVSIIEFVDFSATKVDTCLLYTSPSPRDKRQSRMPSSA